MAIQPIGYVTNCCRQSRGVVPVLLIIGIYHLFASSYTCTSSCERSVDTASPLAEHVPRDVIQVSAAVPIQQPPPPAESTPARVKVDVPVSKGGRVCPPNKHPPPGQYKITSFTNHVIPPTCTSDFEACRLNEDRAPISSRPAARNGTVRVQDLVTLTIKTRHRYLEVEEFIRSVYKFYDKLPVVVMDEFNPNMSDKSFAKWTRFVSETPTVEHAQARPSVGYGRQLAARLARTPYVLIADDDYIFTEKANLDKLLKVLEETDADIVAGATSDKFRFAGAIRIAPEEGAPKARPHLALYPGIFHDRLPCFANCYVADIVKTFFLARRDVILAAGSWDATRPFYEHEDFFFQMRKARVKVAYCDDVIVNHVARTRTLAGLRHQHFDELKTSLQNKWQMSDYYLCQVPDTYTNSYICPPKKRKHFR